MADDLSDDALREHLTDRQVAGYPALLSTESVAMAWARDGRPDGSVVVADYQASPRGRGGLPWTVRPGAGLGFSMVMRPELPTSHGDWLYVASTTAIADVAGPRATVTWPDQVTVDDDRYAAVGLHIEPGRTGISWATLTCLLERASPPRGPRLAEVVRAIESRRSQPAEEVLAVYRDRCATLGRSVRARLIPMGPNGVVLTGVATDCRDDGALILDLGNGRRLAVPPSNLGVLEDDPD